MKHVSIAAGLAISCVAFVALLGAEPYLIAPDDDIGESGTWACCDGPITEKNCCIKVPNNESILGNSFKYVSELHRKAWAEPNPSRYEICDPGYSRSHRMPYLESSAIKHRMLPYGHTMSEYELDHIIPLCLGGSNNSSNLMLQPWPEARLKDRLEIAACRAVCNGSMSLETGRKLFVDWRQGYFDMFGERP